MAKTPLYYFPLGTPHGIIASIWMSLLTSTLVILKLLLDLLLHPTTFLSVIDRTGPNRPDGPLDAYGAHLFIRLKKQKIKLHYVSAGNEDRQLMLFVHGFPECWFSWRHQMKAFRDRYHTVAVNMRGYGESDRPQDVASYAFKTLVDDLIELIESLVTNRQPKCLLVAHDWGGLLSWTVAQQRPDLIDRFIVLNAPHIDSWKYRLATSWTQFLSSWYIFLFNIPYLPEFALRAVDLSFFEAIVEQYCKATKAERDSIIAVYKHYFSSPGAFTGPLNYYRAVLRGYGSGEQYAITKVQPKTLIIWGKADIALNSQLAAESASLCNAATVHYLEGCSHFVAMERPEVVNDIISQWIAGK